jgi:hypothetical protein
MISQTAFPEKIILSITSHGWIECKDDKPELFTVPNDITIQSINMASLGVVNFLDKNPIMKALREMRKRKKSLLNSNDLSKKENSLEFLKESIKRTDYEEKKILEEELKDMMTTNIDDDESIQRKQFIIDYLHNIDKGHRKYIFKPGNIAINKRFERENCEATKYEWVITVLNLPGEPDLLQMMTRQTRYGSCQTSLKEIVNYLKSHGVKEIVIFDFSCSVFINNNYYLDQRNVRKIRRDLLKDTSIFGSNYTKTRKTKPKSYKKILRKRYTRKNR